MTTARGHRSDACRYAGLAAGWLAGHAHGRHLHSPPRHPGITMHNAILFRADSPHAALGTDPGRARRSQGGPADPQSGTSHIAFDVADIHAAVAHLRTACGWSPTPGTRNPTRHRPRRRHRLLQRSRRHLPGNSTRPPLTSPSAEPNASPHPRSGKRHDRWTSAPSKPYRAVTATSKAAACQEEIQQAHLPSSLRSALARRWNRQGANEWRFDP